MVTLPPARSAAARLSPIDRAMAELLHLALDDDWDPQVAADRLRAVVDDGRVYDLLARRIRRAHLVHASVVAERAALTLVAVGAVDVDGVGAGPTSD